MSANKLNIEFPKPTTNAKGRRLAPWEASGDWVWGKRRLPPTGPGPHPLPYPYTVGAMWTQFPWKHYYNRSWVMRGWFWGQLLCIPIFTWATWKVGGFRNKRAFKGREHAHH